MGQCVNFHTFEAFRLFRVESLKFNHVVFVTHESEIQTVSGSGEHDSWFVLFM